MTFKIRDATTLDLPRIVDLNEDIQRQHAAAYPSDFLYPTDPKDVSDFFEKLVNDDSQKMLLATFRDETVAYLWYEIQRLRPNPFKQSIDRQFVHHVFVRSAYRRQGVAKLLFEHVQAAAMSGGHNEIVLDTWVVNTDAQAFFASQGFEAYRIFFRKKPGSVKGN